MSACHGESLGFPCFSLHVISQKSSKVTQGSQAPLSKALPKLLLIWLPLPSCDLEPHVTTLGHRHVDFPGHHFNSRFCNNGQKSAHKKVGTSWCPKKGQLRSTDVHGRLWEGPSSFVSSGISFWNSGLTGSLCPLSLLSIKAQHGHRKLGSGADVCRGPLCVVHGESLSLQTQSS